MVCAGIVWASQLLDLANLGSWPDHVEILPFHASLENVCVFLLARLCVCHIVDENRVLQYVTTVKGRIMRCEFRKCMHRKQLVISSQFW